jgi:hypothetical protein
MTIMSKTQKEDKQQPENVLQMLNAALKSGQAKIMSSCTIRRGRKSVIVILYDVVQVGDELVENKEKK